MKNKISLTVAVLGLSLAICSNANAGPVITVTPVLMPRFGPSWWVAAQKIIDDAMADNLAGLYSVTNGVAGYGRCLHKIDWCNLVYSTNSAMFMGNLNPSAPFNLERGGPNVFCLVTIMSPSGADEVSLDMIELKTYSNSGNLLWNTNSLTTMSEYGPAAPLIKADGTIVTSGPMSQKGKKAMVIMSTSIIDWGDTQQGLDIVRDWFQAFGNFELTFVAQVKGDDSTKSWAVVSTGGLGPIQASPVMRIAPSSGSVGSVSVSFMERNRQYRILSRQYADQGAWQFRALVSHTNASIIIPMNASSQFYRAEMQ